MSASPRPLLDSERPQRPPAPVVPVLQRRTPRGPSPEVVRRRRILALAGVVVLLALPLAAIFVGGGGSSAADRITSILKAGSAKPASLCDHLSSGMSAAIGGRAACVAASPAKGPAGKVQDVRISGDRGTAKVVSAAGTERVRVVRQGGEWKVDDVG